MQDQDLLKILRDAGLDDNAIIDLLNNTLNTLNGANQEEAQAQDGNCPECDEDAKMKKIFGA